MQNLSQIGDHDMRYRGRDLLILLESHRVWLLIAYKTPNGALHVQVMAINLFEVLCVFKINVFQKAKD